MKEVDFLPEWYKSGRRRQINYRTQYVALGGILMVMVLWNFFAAHSASKAATELARLESKQTQGQGLSEEFNKTKEQVTQLQKKAESIEEIDSKIRVGNVLAELSFLVDERMVLSKVDIKAERLPDSAKSQTGSGSAVTTASSVRGSRFGSKQTLLLGDVRFKVMISGMAADASDVAELVCKLEDSQYFRQVYPSFSRSKEIKQGVGHGNQTYQMTEFEISCYLANYQQDERYFAKKLTTQTPER